MEKMKGRTEGWKEGGKRARGRQMWAIAGWRQKGGEKKKKTFINKKLVMISKLFDRACRHTEEGRKEESQLLHGLALLLMCPCPV
jgi:hypothetical protein